MITRTLVSLTTIESESMPKTDFKPKVGNLTIETIESVLGAKLERGEAIVISAEEIKKKIKKVVAIWFNQYIIIFVPIKQTFKRCIIIDVPFLFLPRKLIKSKGRTK